MIAAKTTAKMISLDQLNQKINQNQDEMRSLNSQFIERLTEAVTDWAKHPIKYKISTVRFDDLVVKQSQVGYTYYK